MKKFFIAIAALALVASAACTKVNPEEKKTEKISFQVANYVPQTKANSSLDSEGYNSFYCYAWYFGAPMQYMNNVEVKKGTNEWAPAQDYYWPKTGYINFYSYAGSQAPSVTPSTDMKTVTVAYADKTIASTDNFMVADPALHFGVANFDADLVTINDEQGNFNYTTGKYDYTTSTQSYKGVPTLFHHMLAKVAFLVKLETAEANKSANTTWTVTVLNTSDNPSTLKPVNMGSLTLKNTDAAADAGMGTWSVYNGTTEVTDAAAKKIGWVAGTSTETISFATKTLTIQPNANVSAETDNKLLEVRTVMPQATSGVAFDFAYQVSAQHTGDSAPFMTEIIKVSNKTLAQVTNSTPAAWNMNQITLYTITIDPVGKRVTFDPAVVEWDSTTGAITLP